MVFFKALSLFLGTVIGAGIFGLPYAAMKAGFLTVAFYIIFLAVLAIIVHLLYAEVSIATRENLRLTGYAQKFLSPFWKKASAAIVVIGLFGALLPYLIIAGEFLNNILKSQFGDNAFLLTLFIFLVGSYLVLKDIKNVTNAEFLLVGFIFLILGYFMIRVFPQTKFANFREFDKTFLFFPYGIVLFSLWGSSVIPDIEEFLQKSNKTKKQVDKILRHTVVWGLIISASVYILFTALVLGVSGKNTTIEAISGMQPIMGKAFVVIGSLFGLLCCFTSYITIGQYLKKTLSYDFKVPPNASWFFVCAVPLILFLLGFRNYLGIIGFVGAVSTGIESIIVVLLYRSVKIKMKGKFNPLYYAIIIFFVFGIAAEAIYLLTKF